MMMSAYLIYENEEIIDVKISCRNSINGLQYSLLRIFETTLLFLIQISFLFLILVNPASEYHSLIENFFSHHHKQPQINPSDLDLIQLHDHFH